MHFSTLLSLLLVCGAGGEAADGLSITDGARFQCQRLADLPNATGVAGAYAGISHGALIVAGGANFPKAMPWDGGQKVWYDQIYVLEHADGAWQTSLARLPRPLGYGVSLSCDDGILCLGGGDAVRHYADAFLVRWINGKIEIDDLPKLPQAVAFSTGAILDRTAYIAGGLASPDAKTTMKTFWSLDLNQPREKRKWRELGPWPGRGRMLAVAGVQSGSFFLFSGVDLEADANGGEPRRTYLRDAYRYTPGQGWEEIAPLPRPVAAAPSPSLALGQSHLAIIGGDDGSQRNLTDLTAHRGFSSDIVGYNTITNVWTTLDRLTESCVSKVTTPLAAWQDGFVAPSGEVRPGVRSPRVDFYRPLAQHTAFGVFNYSMLFLYLAVIVLVGCWFSRRNKNTNDFFRGGQRVPWWAAGLSIYATMLSSITYMAVPAKAYAADWSFYFNILAIPLVAPIVVFLYLPFYRRLDVTSAYEYLEKRFNLAVRWFGSVSFVLLQVGRMAIVLYLPALALATVSSLDIYFCILMMSVLCIIYTMLGGIEAVIWTDVIQSIVLLTGAFLTIILVVVKTDGGLMGVLYTAHREAKIFENVDWGWDTTAATIGVILVGSIFANLVFYTSSQDVVQRYMTTKNTKMAARSIWTNALMVIPAGALFFAMGTALFVFYQDNPQQMPPHLATDAVLPLFVVQMMPAGVGGLVVAGIFAASQSTLSSGLNSVATCMVVDFYRRLIPGATDRTGLLLARVITVITGVAITIVACIMVSINILSLWDSFLTILCLTGGILSGLFALGFFTTKANARGAICGIVISLAALFAVQQYTAVHFMLYAAIGTIVCFVAGWLASWCFGE